MDQWIFQITYLDTIGLDGNEAVKKKGALDRPIDTGLAQRGVTESKKKKKVKASELLTSARRKTCLRVVLEKG